MKIELSSEQHLLLESFRLLFSRHSTPAQVRAAEPIGFDRVLWEQLSEMGALVMRAPETSGGGGFSLLDALIVMEEAGRHLASIPPDRSDRDQSAARAACRRRPAIV
jgi:alkylation response protein AidB-like acyl-CoA dehydrogenase